MFWRTWFLDLPVWLTPTFILLALSETYVTTWTRARLRDILKLALTLQLGLLVSLGIALLIDPYNYVQQLLIRALVIGSLCHPAILGSRLLHRFVEELVCWAKAKSEMSGAGKRVVLCGAGGRCSLFLSVRALEPSGQSDGRIIIGIIDDDPALHSRWIFGYKVLGASEDLPKLIGPHGIAGVIIVEEQNPEARKTLEQMAAKHRFQLSEWCFEERTIEVHADTLPVFDAT